jgi:hypothetical protein
MRSYLKEKIAVPVLKTDINDRGESRVDHATPLYREKLAIKFANQRRSLSRYSSLAD